MPVVPRSWFVGVAHDLAAAYRSGVGNGFLASAPEFWARGLWSSEAGLSAGAGLGLLLPIPSALSGDNETFAQTIRVVRPWGASSFATEAVTLRPWYDVRHITGRVLFQLRQGVDLRFNIVGDAPHKSDLVARTMFYVGYRPVDRLGVGLELWEAYELTADLPDAERAAFALSPSLRASLGSVPARP